MAMTPPHYLANLLNHRYRDQKLNQDQLEKAIEHSNAYHPEAMSFIVQYQAKVLHSKNIYSQIR